MLSPAHAAASASPVGSTNRVAMLCVHRTGGHGKHHSRFGLARSGVWLGKSCLKPESARERQESCFPRTCRTPSRTSGQPHSHSVRPARHRAAARQPFPAVFRHRKRDQRSRASEGAGASRGSNLQNQTKTVVVFSVLLKRSGSLGKLAETSCSCGSRS